MIFKAFLKKIMKYLKKTQDLSLRYEKGSQVYLDGYSDSSFNDDPDKGKSTCSFTVALSDSTIAWKSKLSQGVPQSVMEAEIIAQCMCAKELVWCQHLLKEILGGPQLKGVLHCDNDPAISHTMNHKVSDRSKHIRPKYFYVRELVDKDEISVVGIATSENVADIGTKALDWSQLSYLRSKLGLVPRK